MDDCLIRTKSVEMNFFPIINKIKELIHATTKEQHTTTEWVTHCLEKIVDNDKAGRITELCGKINEDRLEQLAKDCGGKMKVENIAQLIKISSTALKPMVFGVHEDTTTPANDNTSFNILHTLIGLRESDADFRDKFIVDHDERELADLVNKSREEFAEICTYVKADDMLKFANALYSFIHKGDKIKFNCNDENYSKCKAQYHTFELSFLEQVELLKIKRFSLDVWTVGRSIFHEIERLKYEEQKDDQANLCEKIRK